MKFTLSANIVQKKTSSNNPSSTPKQQADADSLSSGSSGGPAPLPPNEDDDSPQLVAPLLVVANICTNLASMTGAIFCWYFAAHTQIFLTGFFEGALNIGASVALLSMLLCKTISIHAKIAFSFIIFLVGFLADVAVCLRTASNLFFDLSGYSTDMHSFKDLVLKILGHALTIFGAAASSACFVVLAIRGIKGAIRSHRNPNREFNSEVFGRPYRSARSALLNAGKQQQLSDQTSFCERRRCVSLIENAAIVDDSPNAFPENADEDNGIQDEPGVLYDSPDSVEQAYFESQKIESGDVVWTKRDNEDIEQGKVSGPGDETVISAGDGILTDLSKQLNRASSVQRYLRQNASKSRSSDRFSSNMETTT